MNEREALKLALEALEAHADIGIKSDKAITAIKEALAQPEQLREENERLHVENRRLIDRIETIGVPVGVGGFATTTSVQPEQEKTVCPFCSSEWVTAEQHDRFVDRLEQEPCCYGGIAHDCHAGDGCRIAERLKATTPPQRKPLTDEEIRKANHHMVEGAYDYSFKQGVKWAEYKHGIKELA